MSSYGYPAGPFTRRRYFARICDVYHARNPELSREEVELRVRPVFNNVLAENDGMIDRYFETNVLELVFPNKFRENRHRLKIQKKIEKAAAAA